MTPHRDHMIRGRLRQTESGPARATRMLFSRTGQAVERKPRGVFRPHPRGPAGLPRALER
ncbi:hypothetical protein CH63R_04336 [Colletotrichum higginsianum IMI 349063]|uniref:Uncharacterized protein n=1 Tax=Colletotrichum higginsianum (strain IMI 349063) TaxID=759273 RepID=A0A1B7YJ50_COLHI|nr:hypothetical protein CH63R_04336 [Colletotrichum higginsianum IMI 349063]OBR12040.1 hypothetical protein CH63R_04336 [Colletotrichum higginsianum IMI 349063]